MPDANTLALGKHMTSLLVDFLERIKVIYTNTLGIINSLQVVFKVFFNAQDELIQSIYIHHCILMLSSRMNTNKVAEEFQLGLPFEPKFTFTQFLLLAVTITIGCRHLWQPAHPHLGSHFGYPDRAW
jgi:hypothetical protein